MRKNSKFCKKKIQINKFSNKKIKIFLHFNKNNNLKDFQFNKGKNLNKAHMMKLLSLVIVKKALINKIKKRVFKK